MLPALLHLLTFKFYPMLEAFRLSFYHYDLMSPPVFHGLENYRAVWENPLFHQSFWVSVKYMFGVSIPEWFLALGLALLLNRQMPGRSLIRLAYFFPIAMSQIVVALVWKFMYNPLGVVNTLLGGVGVGRINWLVYRGDGVARADPHRHLAGHPALRRHLPGRAAIDPQGVSRSGDGGRRGRHGRASSTSRSRCSCPPSSSSWSCRCSRP